MYERTEALLNNSVQHLCLTITLWMVGRAHAELSTAKLEQFLPKTTYEKRVTVRYQAPGHTMNLSDDIHEQTSYRMGCMGCGQHAQMDPFGKSIHNNKNNSVTMIRRKANNEVKGEVFPWPVRNG